MKEFILSTKRKKNFKISNREIVISLTILNSSPESFLFFFYFFRLSSKYMDVCVWVMCMGVQVPLETRGGHCSPRAEVIGSCELLKVCARN